MKKPMRGQVVDGWKFVGGDPKDRNNWTPADNPDWSRFEHANVPLRESMKEEIESRGTFDRFVGGANNAFDRAAYGLKQAFTPLSDQEVQRIRMGDIASQTGAGMAGNILGNTALSAPIFGKAMGLANAVPGAMARLASMMGLGGAAGAGYGALTAPENRSMGALVGGGAGAVGGALSWLGSGPARPRPGTDAAALAGEGIPLTSGQSIGGRAKVLEDALRSTSGSVAKRQGEALEKFSQVAVNKSLPPGAKQITGTGRNAIAEGAEAFKDAYSAAFKSAGPVKYTNRLRVALADVLSKHRGRLSIDEIAEVSKQIAKIEGEFNVNINKGMVVSKKIEPELAKKLVSRVRGLASNADDFRLQEAYSDIGSAIKNEIGAQYPKAGKALAEIDAKYPLFKSVQKAAGKIGAQEGVFTPAQLKSAVRSVGGETAFARGNAVPEMLQLAERGQRVLGASIPQVGPGTAEKALVQGSLMTPSKWIPSILADIAYSSPAQAMLLGRASLNPAIAPMATTLTAQQLNKKPQ